ncbi:proteasome ATPase [Corynebacterium aquatimens]|uniref:AAA ATPase forming ring-shaped complexes n=1 Tax=Corynebacterium aquatimens TaxID=1190508 RepID=A0A931DWL2_9CORY|nr:proteasome ATPase [Corynebacterium aquatimens]MBG6121592.1 proteasome-associated ATPase [Corynebacterium aquatimens]WJY65868.1 Proteasome-associated ATPase [Corynebacterium aquatimens]
MTTPIDPLEVAAENRELKRKNAALGARNKQLSQVLQVTRDRFQGLTQQVDELAKPTCTYGVFLESFRGGKEADVFTGGRRLRVNISPNVEPTSLTPGVRVRLGEGAIVVEARGFSDTGTLATLVERVGGDRAIAADMQGSESLVHLTEKLQREARAGDTVLVDNRVGFAFEVIPKTEVAQLTLEEIPDVTYDDIGGLHEQIETIRDSVELPFMYPDLYKQYHLAPPKGLLLYGPPGCGKTLIAKAVANSLSARIGDGGSAHFLNIKGPELLNKYVGETERRIRLIFERARELAGEGRPVIVFFDEMESIFRTRGSGVSSDMETTVVPQLLTEIDGVEDLANVIVIGATNREELIDPAILRPGRLDIKIRVDRPTRAEASDIFARHLTEDVPHVGEVSELISSAVEALFAPRPFVRLTLVDGTEEILHYSDFVSGAMIANIVDRAKKLAIKDVIAAGGSFASGGSTASGITAEHLRQAVLAEQEESEDMPNTANPDEWTRIIGRTGKRVVEAEVL